MQPQMYNKNFIILVFILVSLIIICFFTAATTLGHKRTISNQNFSYTPQDNRIDVAKTSSFPTYTSFTKLLDNGMTADQLTGLKYAFAEYIKSSGKIVKNVSLDTASITTPPLDTSHPSANANLNFRVSLGGPPYSAHVEYSLVSSEVRLALDSNGTQVYDSGIVDINTQNPAN